MIYANVTLPELMAHMGLTSEQRTQLAAWAEAASRDLAAAAAIRGIPHDDTLSICWELGMVSQP